MRGRTEAYGWACWYGVGAGLAVVAAQDAAEQARTGWMVVFGAYALAVLPVYFLLLWRELLDG